MGVFLVLFKACEKRRERVLLIMEERERRRKKEMREERSDDDVKRDEGMIGGMIDGMKRRRSEGPRGKGC